MKTSLACLLAAVTLISFQANGVRATDDDVKTAARNAKIALSAARERFEKELALLIRLREQGAVSEREVDISRLNLAAIEHDLAIVEGRTSDIAKHVRTILTIRERHWKNLASLRAQSLASPEELQRAERSVAYARYRLAASENNDEESVRQLQALVESNEKTLRRMEESERRDSISNLEMYRIRANLAFCHYRLFVFQGRSEEARKSLKSHVEMRKQVAEFYEKLLDKKMAGQTETYVAQRDLLLSQTWLARDQTDLDAVRRLLAAQAAINDKLAQLCRAEGIGPYPLDEAFFKAAAAGCRFELASATDTNALARLSLYLPVYETE